MKFKSALALPILFAAGLLLLADASYFTVDQRLVAVVLQFGKLQRVETEPGFHARIPFVQTVKKFDARLVTADSGELAIVTQDRKALQINAFIKWRVADAATFYRATAGQSLRSTDLMSKALDRVLTEQLALHTLAQISSGDAATLAALKQAVAEQVKALGVDVADLRIAAIELPKDDDLTNAVYDRMRAERQRVAAEVRGQGSEDAQKVRAEADATAQTVLADAYRQTEQLRGEGDAKATEIYAKSYSEDPEFFSFYRSMNAYRDSFKDKQDVLVLEPKGSFFKYFNDAGGSR